MIKVSNYPRCGRPHAGLSFADLVNEYYIGEQMNRFLAVHYGQDSHQVGPLRSGRLIDLQQFRWSTGSTITRSPFQRNYCVCDLYRVCAYPA